MSSPRLAIKPQEKPSTGDKLDGALCVVQITLVMVNILGGSVTRLHAKKQPGTTPDLRGCSDLFEIPSLKLKYARSSVYRQISVSNPSQKPGNFKQHT